MYDFDEGNSLCVVFLQYTYKLLRQEQRDAHLGAAAAAAAVCVLGRKIYIHINNTILGVSCIVIKVLTLYCRLMKL